MDVCNQAKHLQGQTPSGCVCVCVGVSVCVCVGVGPSEAVILTHVATLIKRFGIYVTQIPNFAYIAQLKQSAHVPTPLLLREVYFSLMFLQSTPLPFPSPAC